MVYFSHRFVPTPDDVPRHVVKYQCISFELSSPILRGRDIKRYSYEFADQYIIATFPSRQYNIDDYQSLKSYLLSFGIEKLEQTGKVYVVNGETIKARKKTSNKWFETQDSISYWVE